MLEHRPVEVDLAESGAAPRSDADLALRRPVRGRRAARPPSPTRAGAGDARPGYKRTALLRPGAPDAGLRRRASGSRGRFDPERARVAAALASRQAASLEARTVAWVPPDEGEDDAQVAAALVEGTDARRPTASTASRARTRRRADAAASRRWSSLGASEGARGGRASWRSSRAAAAPTARASFRTCRRTWPPPPTSPSAPARSPSAHDRVSVEVMDRAEIETLGMGGLVARRARHRRGAAADRPALHRGGGAARRWRSSARP